MSNISILGLGAMGSALAKALLDNGMQVTVWNRSAEKALPLVERGAIHAANATEALQASPVTIISALDYQAVEEIVQPSSGTLVGRTLINLTNGTLSQVRAMAAWARQCGAEYLDGGVMVTPDLIGTEQAFVLYGGSQKAFDASEDLLTILGKPVYVGADPAMAQLFDLAMLSAMFGMFGGYLHAAALLESEQVPAREVTPMIMSLLQAMVGLLPHIAEEIDTKPNLQPDSNNAMMAVALKNVVEGSIEQGIEPSLLEPIRALFARGVANGLGARDIAALVPLFKV
ncbi:NAD(P)-binding domain-containing protein [Alkalimonas collagenimarina]|uniref:NAD(P)-binding domain-containing protein n=2 Tax=Alkalimonas collagenimarina TaxID=400390 RepID=A0ABT9GUL3_9GAMM|nr:NAD(P)-binding domain-containing protein [Alkalimonas collagenimarina]MDP4534732.1 NAD(P)-binding domain-containing protein [Alkalimonas collagenimarina]